MKVTKFKENNGLEKYLIVIEPGEALVENLEKFVLSKEKVPNEKIGICSLRVIGGGCRGVKFAFSVGFETGYITKEVEGPLELIGSDECIAWDSDDLNRPMVHLHASFIDNKLEKSFGGHLIEVKKVGLTAEIWLYVESREKHTRDLDKRVNVKLLNPPIYSFDGQGQNE